MLATSEESKNCSWDESVLVLMLVLGGHSSSSVSPACSVGLFQGRCEDVLLEYFCGIGMDIDSAVFSCQDNVGVGEGFCGGDGLSEPVQGKA